MTFSSVSAECRNDEFWRFLASVERAGDHNADDVYYAYIPTATSIRPPLGCTPRQLPETAEEAREIGFLVIEATSPGCYYLQIANQEYESNEIFTLEQILFKWATAEGYRW